MCLLGFEEEIPGVENRMIRLHVNGRTSVGVHIA